MKQILSIVHTPSVNTSLISKSVIKSLKNQKLNLKIKFLKPLEASSEDVFDADGILLGTTENLGSMAGATKDFFDRTYYEVIDKKEGLPIAVWIRAGHDGTGASRQIQSIVNGLKWKLVQEILVCKGSWDEKFIGDCVELSLGFAYGVEQNIF